MSQPTYNPKEVTRRHFFELAGVGLAGTFLLGQSDALASDPVPVRDGTVTCGVALLMQTPDPQRYTGPWARQCIAPCWEGLTSPTSLAERNQLLKEHGPDAVIPEVRPMLADKWEIGKEGTRYIFHLKKGVVFHNGKELEAEDVAWGWKRIQDPIHFSANRKFLTLYLESIETPDRYTVVANLSRPYGGFLMANAWCFAAILPKDSIPYGSIWGSTPTFQPDSVAPPGTGPFMMTEYQQNHQAVYEKFADYRVPDLPYLGKIVYKVMGETGPRTLALRAGNLDYATTVNSNWLAEKLKGRELNTQYYLPDEKLNIYPVISSFTRTIYLNAHPEYDTPFKDERVRQALDYCLDREILARALHGNLGIPLGQGYNPEISSWGYSDLKERKRDIAKAKALLKEAGYPDGLDVEFKITPSFGKNDLRAQIIQQMAKPAGFRISITSLVGLQYGVSLRTRNYHMMMNNIVREDPMNEYYNYLHSDSAPPYNGYSPRLGIRDAEMDRLLDQVAEETDLQTRKTIFKQVVQRAIDKAYWLPNNQEIVSDGWSPRLRNFNPWDCFQPQQAFAEAWIEED